VRLCWLTRWEERRRSLMLELYARIPAITQLFRLLLLAVLISSLLTCLSPILMIPFRCNIRQTAVPKCHRNFRPFPTHLDSSKSCRSHPAIK